MPAGSRSSPVATSRAAPCLLHPHPHPCGMQSGAASPGAPHSSSSSRSWHILLAARGGGTPPGLWWLDGLPGAVGNSKCQAGIAASPIPPALVLSLRLQAAGCRVPTGMRGCVTLSPQQGLCPGVKPCGVTNGGLGVTQGCAGVRHPLAPGGRVGNSRSRQPRRKY